MSIAAKSATQPGPSASRGDYRASFLRGAHRLIARGHARMKPESQSKVAEEVISEKLFIAINEIIEGPGAERWINRYHAADDVRVPHPKRKGKRRPRVDIEIANVKTGPRPRLHFEAKRL